MKKMHKLSALLLVAALFAALLPMAVFATAEGDLTAGGTIVLDSDVMLANVVTITIDTTIDLNGHTITAADGKNGIEAVGATLTIKDSTGTGRIVANGDSVSAVRAGQNKNVIATPAAGSVVLESGSIEAPNGFGVTVWQNSSLTVTGGIVKGSTAISGNGDNNGNTINISGGIIFGTIGVYHPQNGTLNISGSAMINALSTGVEVRAGEFNLSGGTITTNASGTSIGANGSGNTVSGAAVAVSPHSTGHPLSFTMTGGTLNAESGGAGIVESNAQGSATVPTLSMSAGSVNSATPVLTETAAGDDFITGGSFSDKPRGDSIKDNEELGGYAAAVADAGGYKVLPASGIKAGTSSEYFESVEGALATNPDGLIINGDALEDGDTFDIPAGVDAGITYPNSNPGAVEPLPAGGYEVSVPEGSTKPVVTPVSSGVPGEPEPTPGRPNPSTGVKLGGACR